MPRRAPGFLHEPGDVVVEEGQRLLHLAADRLGPRAGASGRGHEALDDEAIGRLEKEDVLHRALIEERADRAEDLFEVLARTALVDPHAVRGLLEIASRAGSDRWSGPLECRSGGYRAARSARADGHTPAQVAARRTASSPATRASLTIRAVFARRDAPSVRTAIRASSQGVRAGPAMPSLAASATARSTAARATSSGIASSAGTGTHSEDARRQTEPEMGPDERGRGRHVRDGRRRRDPRRARVEARQLRLADRDDRDAPRLEVFERGRHVEDRLRPGAHDGHRRCARAPPGRTRCRASAAHPARARPGRRDGRRRCRPWRRPRSRRRAPRSSWPRRSWPPSRRRPARRRGSAARPCGRSPPAPWQGPRATPRPARRAAARRGSPPWPGSRRPSGRPPPRRRRPRGSGGTAGRG